MNNTRFAFDPDKPLDEWSDAEKRALLDRVEEMNIDFADSLRRFRDEHATPASQEDSDPE